MWVAKFKNFDGSVCNKELSPRFESIIDCQNWIDNNCKVLEYLLSHALRELDRIENVCCIRLGSLVRCYNIEQQRFCTGFDF